MFIMCVQTVYNKTYTKTIHSCQKHTNQKREKGLNHTVFWSGTNQRPDGTPYLDDEEKEELD